MQIILYGFGKKINSTETPSGTTASYTVDGIIKAPFSVVTPTVDFNFAQDSNIAAYYNYAYIPILRRYYHIRNWTWSGRLWSADMLCDVLASFKSDIGRSTEFVLRAQSKRNEYLIDNSVPTSAALSVSMSPNIKQEGYNWSGDYNRGSFVVGVVNSDRGSIGAVSYYKFTAAQLRTLSELLLGNPQYLGIDDLSEGVQKALVNPWQYIVSCQWFPFDVAAGASVSSITVGWWNFTVNCYRIAAYGYSVNDLEFVIYKHPKTQTNGKYVGMPPFSEYTLFIPGFGAFDLPPQYLIDEDTITCQIITDSVSGVSTMSVRAGEKEVCKRTAQIGVPITLAGTTINDIAGSVADFAGKLINANLGAQYADQGPTGFAYRALMGFAAASTNVSTAGTNGNLSQFYYHPYLKCVFADQPTIPSSEIGKPLCEYVQISTLSGYVQCAHGEINTTATETEQQMIKEYLEGGFYYA